MQGSSRQGLSISPFLSDHCHVQSSRTQWHKRFRLLKYCRKSATHVMRRGRGIRFRQFRRDARSPIHHSNRIKCFQAR